MSDSTGVGSLSATWQGPEDLVDRWKVKTNYPITSDIGVSSRGVGQLDILVKYEKGSGMLHWWWDDDGWGGPTFLSVRIDGTPGLASWGSGRIDSFMRGDDASLKHGWFDGAWHDEDLGGPIASGVAVASRGVGLLDCFVTGADNHLKHKWWDGSWHGWDDLGGPVDGTPAAVSWGPDRIDCVGRGLENQLRHTWWDGSEWHDWEDLGGTLTSSPAIASCGPNRLDCFAKGPDNALWQTSVDYTVVDGRAGTWTEWESHGGVLYGAPSAVSWGPNRIDVFMRGIDNHPLHMWFA